MTMRPMRIRGGAGACVLAAVCAATMSLPSAALGMFPVLIDRRGRHEGFDGPGVRIASMDQLSTVLEAA